MHDKTMNPTLKLLLETAEEMILEKGCRATTLQDIADRSGLTKGAIYHYVKSKDELFALILESGFEKTNELYFESVAQAASKPADIQGPLNLVSGRMQHAASPDSVSNLIFIYLLSQRDKPAVDDILRRYHETAIRNSATWIEVGKRHGVIPAHIDAKKVAQLFATLKYGLQVQQIVTPDDEVLSDQDIYEFMLNALS
ncbi:TetR/AcrR family transcriptional regulator [Paenibacillus sp. TH7-28]